jgi:hypothetical protein
MLKDFLTKVKLFLEKRSKSKEELFKDVIVEITDNNTITLSIWVSGTVYNKLATFTFVNDHLLLDMSPAAVANSYFTKIILIIVNNCS